QNILTIRAKKLTSFVADVLRTLYRIRKLDIDATVDMEFFARAPAILAFLTGARRRAGLHRFSSEGPYRGDLLTHRVQYNPYLHTAEAYWLLVDALNEEPTTQPVSKRERPSIDWSPPLFQPTETEQASVRELVQHVH